jgi:putative transposase
MANYRRIYTGGNIYFFTLVMYRRQAILCHDDIRTALRSGIMETRKTHPFKVDAWVLMPDHLHCIWTLPENDINFSTRWAMIKRYVTKQCCAEKYQRDEWLNKSRVKRKESTLWQRRFWEHQIRDDQNFQRHFDYLHFNPVKHGYVNSVKEWEFSSFHRYVKNEIYTENWGGVGNIEDDFGEP